MTVDLYVSFFVSFCVFVLTTEILYVLGFLLYAFVHCVCAPVFNVV